MRAISRGTLEQLPCSQMQENITSTSTTKRPEITIYWHRRDLRIQDLPGLKTALRSPFPVLPIFIFDTTILNRLEHKADSRLQFILHAITTLKKAYTKRQSDLLTFHSSPMEAWRFLVEHYDIQQVHFGTDYEPYGRRRDAEVQEFLMSNGVQVVSHKDHVGFGPDEVLKASGDPYKVFTPYRNAWKTKWSHDPQHPVDVSTLLKGCFKIEPSPTPSLEDLGFEPCAIEVPSAHLSSEQLDRYAENRDIPSISGTTRIGPHLRFGTIGIRVALQLGHQHSEKWLDELIWRDFYHMILAHYPHTTERAFKPAYDKIIMDNNEADFTRWCEGTTGYPLVDAGMRELNATGFMHNRVRMLTASFLTKHLLIDWRWGERYFASKLMDFELASNVGGWQWAAGCGCDAAPYFRVFSPARQQVRFDSEELYIKKWVKDYGSSSYPSPIVDHKLARERVIQRYRDGLQPES